MVWKLKDKKIIEHCNFCGKMLAKNSQHHFLCHSCWLNHNKRKGIPIHVLNGMRNGKIWKKMK